MRQAMLAVVAFATLLSVGCHHNIRNGCNSCSSCNSCHSCGHHGDGLAYEEGYDYGEGGEYGGIGHGRLGHGDGIGHGHGHGVLSHGLRHGNGLLANGPTRVPRLPHGYMAEQVYGTGGPPTPSYAYPYYTVRAPRDFLRDNPPSIGP